MLLGIGLILFGWLKLSLGWNFLLFPLGLYLFIRNLRALRRLRFEVYQIDITEKGIKLEYLNGTQQLIPHQKAVFGILVQKYILPLRRLELFEAKTSRGKLRVQKWDRQLEEMTRILLQ